MHLEINFKITSNGWVNWTLNRTLTKLGETEIFLGNVGFSKFQSTNDEI